MFLHTHPFQPFLYPEVTKLIVGTLPPPRFTEGTLKDKDVNFCYGSCSGQLWPILDKIFNLHLAYETSDFAVKQRKNFLINRKIGICDIVASAEREKIDASDLGMKNIKLRNLIGYLQEYKKVNTILFTGGNSKNGPEYFFRKHLKEHQLYLKVVSDKVPRIHEFNMPNQIIKVDRSHINEQRIIRTISLTAPSGAANRAIGSMPAYRKAKDQNANYSTFDFRVAQYRAFF